MKRLISLFLCVLFTFSLCACQQAAPSSSEAPDQQAITEEATEYFNQMMDGDFETFFNALPQGVARAGDPASRSQRIMASTSAAPESFFAAVSTGSGKPLRPVFRSSVRIGPRR